MSQTITPAPIRRSFTVKAGPEKAFQVFTAGIDRWWPRTHTIGKAALAKAVIEPKVGGRWYGRDVDGGEDDWGDVLAWEPPSRLLLAWRINAKFECDPSVHTEVEVTFTDLGDGSCRVDFEHRGLETFGDNEVAVRTRTGMDSGWTLILENFKAAVGG